MKFAKMLKETRLGHEFTQKQMAAKINISHQYLCDLEHGRRLPSVTLTKRICSVFGHGSLGCAAWHQAGARAHGWEV